MSTRSDEHQRSTSDSDSGQHQQQPRPSLAATSQPDICQISFLSPLFPRNSDFPLGLVAVVRGWVWRLLWSPLICCSAPLPCSAAVTKVCRMWRPSTWPCTWPSSKVTALKVLHHKSRWRQIWFLWWLPPPGNASTVHRARGFSPLIKCCVMMSCCKQQAENICSDKKYLLR